MRHREPRIGSDVADWDHRMYRVGRGARPAYLHGAARLSTENLGPERPPAARPRRHRASDYGLAPLHPEGATPASRSGGLPRAGGGGDAAGDFQVRRVQLRGAFAGAPDGKGTKPGFDIRRGGYRPAAPAVG
ncbi:hypothetical protein HPP92_023240 [Vanilla planifolia]|uniref:Uncharacterized protein n=1 Tax=Vanilla planifolia TaxID=51239 RepID=A0A835PSE2_VANPL|nr:hypothetical protein HPP92_023240 [Vanilla planifolia]